MMNKQNIQFGMKTLRSKLIVCVCLYITHIEIYVFSPYRLYLFMSLLQTFIFLDN